MAVSFTMLLSLDLHFLILLVAGILVGVFAVAVGGGMFFSIPLVEAMFPGVSLGAILGNIKVSSFFRSIGSTISTWKNIDLVKNLKIIPAAIVGTLVGSFGISQLSQKWLLPAIALAIAVTLFAPKIAAHITPPRFLIATFFTGLYAGVLGAGIGVILVALMRIPYPKDTEIAHAKIQARFIEFLLVIASLSVHLVSNNLMAQIWIPLSIGTMMGGYFGGLLLRTMGDLSGSLQKKILYAAFAVDLAVAGYKFFE